MGKISKFDKLDEWIKAEYDRETKDIEDSLSNDGSFDPNRIDSDELLQRIKSGIKARDEQEAESGVPEKKQRITVQKVGKCAALFFVALTGVFLASMTSEANRSYFWYSVQNWIGNEMVTDAENENDNNFVEQREQIKVKIGDELDIYVPIFQYKLELDTEDSYNIQNQDTVATIKYKYNDVVVKLRMFNMDRTDISGIDFQGKEIEKLDLLDGVIKIRVLEIRTPEDKASTLAAQWKYKNGYYQLSGKVEKSEFLEIIKSIGY